jgi:ureidoglycolate lyase
MELPIEDLTAEAFAPFGRVVTMPDRATDANGDGWQYWGGLTSLPGTDAGYFVGYLNLRPPTALRFDWAERHALSPELLVPTGGACVIHVAPADYPDELDRLPSLERFRLFRVRPGQAVLLDRKVWHGAPMALGSPSQVMVVLQQGTGPANTSLVQFPMGQAIWL